MRKISLATLNSHPKLLWGLLSFLVLAFWLAPPPRALAHPQERTIPVQASAFQFAPGVIYANPGDQVTLQLTSLDVVHGLYIDGYDLEAWIEPGKTTRLTFTAGESGAFRLRCSVACGAMHPFMVGKLQVGPNWLLWKSITLLGVSLLAGIFVIFRGRHV
jgi:heme/copper-type cytochrome/quinol oxidase subunit 2